MPHIFGNSLKTIKDIVKPNILSESWINFLNLEVIWKNTALILKPDYATLLQNVKNMM